MGVKEEKQNKKMIGQKEDLQIIETHAIPAAEPSPQPTNEPLQETIINGRKATVAFMDNEFHPANRDVATMSKVIFEDGEVLFVSLKREVNLENGREG